MRGLVVVACVWAGAVLLGQAQSRSLFPGTIDQHPAVDYRGASVTDPVSTLHHEIAAGRQSLSFDGEQGYLHGIRLGVAWS